ncbi:hypothetical protein GCM10023116_43250 [Kistimonas scapharcae]|uniref:DUF551 domain-containing protein n=2 Tax=Kistimonas scapharcae TaxID=1036133 RepID=A0ABP8V9J4_9GAMM
MQDDFHADLFSISCPECSLMLDGEYEEDEVKEIWNNRNSPWVSVDDRMPNTDGWYSIVATIDGKRCATMAFLESDYMGQFWLTHNDYKDADIWDGVTHWAPLPELPQ